MCVSELFICVIIPTNTFPPFSPHLQRMLPPSPPTAPAARPVAVVVVSRRIAIYVYVSIYMYVYSDALVGLPYL